MAETKLQSDKLGNATRPDGGRLGPKAVSLANFPRHTSSHKWTLDKKKSDNFDENNRSMHDFISIVLVCSFGGDIPNEYFLYLEPLTTEFNLLGVQPVGAQENWKPTVEAFFKGIGLNLKSEGLVRLDRYYVPGSDRLSLHGVHCVYVKPDLKAAISKAFAGTWVTAKQVVALHDEKRLFSADIAEVIAQLDSPGMALAKGVETMPSSLFIAAEGHPKPAKRSGYDVVVEAAQLRRFEQEMLYAEFMRLVAPFATMGYGSFIKLMRELGWANHTLPALFRSFDIQGKGSLDYRDLLCGVAATEPTTQHGGPPAECRCRYIFRYYDEDDDGKLNYLEFRNLIADIRKTQGMPDDPAALDAETEKSYKIFGPTSNSSIPLCDFLSAVGQLRFRGTSHLLRSPTSVVPYLRKKQASEFHGSTNMKRSKSYAETSSHGNEENSGPRKRHDEAYDIATHSVRVRKSGTVLDIHTLWDIEHSGMFQGQNVRHQNRTDGGKANRIQSYDKFNQDSQPNEMINGLRYFERSIPRDNKSGYSAKPAFDWGEVDRSSLAKCIIGLCKQVRELFMNEPRLIELNSPVYILGDIHGNFPDLICFEKALWRLGPMLTPASFLFLGDYVDRGSMGVEVISYLFAQKLLAPTKFHLLRGNHEIRDVQLMFTFYTECASKFGDKTGPIVWESINSVFDTMPLAAVIDKKVFCAHGGIPPPWIGNGLLKNIKSIPCPLPNPEAQSQLAWELMWSDPIHAESSNINKDGFGSNQRRGTGHVFSEEALSAFLAKNQLSHVVRAHEVQQAGFQVQLGGKLLTVFSSSKYCGGSNEAACILADKFKLRTIRIDTT